jgi:hypothetical protein
MSDELKVFGGVVGLVVIVIFLALGPKGCSRNFAAWSAKAYGANWLVVQYTQSGGVIACWNLKNGSVTSEANSDGIFFKTNESNIVHLSGHYVYMQLLGEGSTLDARYQKEKKVLKVPIKCHGE